MRTVSLLLGMVAAGLFCACGRVEPPSANIYPDYADGIVIPCNIAPLNFLMADGRTHRVRVEACDSKGNVLGSQLYARCKNLIFNESDWRNMIASATGGFLRIVVDDTASRLWRISSDSIDPYLVYRLGPHDQNTGGRLQVYERNITDFSHRCLMDNLQTENNCMNCHSLGADAKMVFHVREAFAGTVITLGNDSSLKISVPARYGFRLSYPTWSPNGRYIAFATTRIAPVQFVNPHRTQDLMPDVAAWIVLYDTRQNRLFSCPALTDTAFCFSFPTWAPNGKSLYFCRTPHMEVWNLPQEREKECLAEFRYDLFRIDFDADSETFGEPEMVYSPLGGNFGGAAGDSVNRSASIPSASPDGKFLFVSTVMMGSFPSQNQGDLILLQWDSTEDGRAYLREVHTPGFNSPDADRRGVWSANGKWFVFTSKRESGAQSLLYLAHFDGSAPDEQKISKPFVLPQKQPDHYIWNTRSYTFPVFSGKPLPFDGKTYKDIVEQHLSSPDMSFFDTSGMVSGSVDATSGASQAVSSTNFGGH